MKVDVRCLNCLCGPENHPEEYPGSNDSCECGQCKGYAAPLSELELAIALAAVDREAEELREYKRLLEYVERKFGPLIVAPTKWFGSFSKIRESLRERMEEEGK